MRLAVGVNTSNESTKSVILFDIDGTLVDSNYLHVDAWDRAFTTVGHPVDVWRIHRLIGMDSAMLLERLLGDAAETVGDQAKELHSSNYLANTDRLRAIGGANDLVAELSRRGHTVVLATSAPQNELDILLNVLDVDDSIDAVTNADDVGSAKPNPDLINVALDKASATADHAVMVGDSVWDVEAAKRAGVKTIGLLSGGFGRDELVDAGAAEVYDDVADLLLHIDESLLTK